MSEALSLCVEGKYGEEEYCQLGSGTGLMIYNGKNPPTLVGFASKATAECSFGDPYVFSSVSPFVEWIQGIEGFVGNTTARDAKAFECNLKGEPKIGTSVSAKYGRYPYMASIRSNIVHEWQGVLIDSDHLLTVGSPLDPTKTYTALIGAVKADDKDEKDPHELIEIESVIYHPKIQDRENPVDLAILKLKKKSKFTPIRLPFNRIPCYIDILMDCS